MLEFVPPSGSLVVSDVDDTILETLILSNREMLAHSLKNKHKAASGMPQLYERISAQLHDRDGHKPAWLYLSGSPWGLQPFLMDFLYAYYPPPSAFVLSDISLRSLRETAGTYDLKSYKQGQVREYMRRLPGKSLVLIGDATQYDPDSYAALYEEYPDNVLCILIREAQGSSAREKENAQNDMGRLRTAFKNVPQDRWRVFRHPSELVHIDFSSKKCH
ncbi:hypothetical protein CXG81DRAFT_13757 [Caulochytrium protostelioides]|uniref:Phosphatidate phosphatase APP1 catalytic domain-containing protein n=1 Tax=Caulochytrium protostelioides TaxID=1555241 RepID=A0A4P9X4I8_9FUNG|nr:hypothetical protein CAUPRSCDRAFT_7573 [Caulochytrium protostelioides]RKO99995.1 hypothetical protein CXG81DRAFT_13757 [Caulochytrium protostelioides]|eukprot:RKO99995.1 hypothetical protein CXG81DRAFT_13757 [Caulochytrium protostelioides]